MKKKTKKKYPKSEDIKFSPNLDSVLSGWLHTNYLY